MNSHVCRAISSRVLRAAVLLLALACCAATCEEQPVVHLGRLAPGAAGMALPTGGAAGHDESRECEEFDPVCGANDMTYPSTCAAILAGTSVLHRGPC